MSEQLMNNTAGDFFGDLESLASGLQSSSGKSLNSAVREFLEGNPRARNAQGSAAEAETQGATLAFALYQHLRSEGFDPDVLQCKGFKGKLVDCSPTMEEAIRELGQRLIAQDLIHYVVQVGNIVLDLAFRRLGSEYIHSNNAIFNQFKQHWVVVHTLAPRALTSPSAFLQAARAALSMTNLKKAQARLDASNDWGGGFGVVTASDLANAFEGKAKRNRRTRLVATAATDPSLPKNVNRILLKAVASDDDMKDRYMRLLMEFRGLFTENCAPTSGLMDVVNEYRARLKDVLSGLAFSDLPYNAREALIASLEDATVYKLARCSRPESPTRSQEQALALYDHSLTHERLLGNIPTSESSEVSVDDLEYCLRRFFHVIDLAALLYEGSVRQARLHYQHYKDLLAPILTQDLTRQLG